MSLRWRDRNAVLPAELRSTPRFMLAFGVWTALVYGVFGGPRSNWFSIFHWYIEACLSAVHGAMLGVALGGAQLRILVVHRWRIDGWVRWTILLILAGNLVTHFAVESASRMMNALRGADWLPGCIWSISFGLLAGLGTARVLWKDQWPTDWPLWVLGRAGATVLGWAGGASMLLLPWPNSVLKGDLVVRSAVLALQGAVAGFLEGAGTAWLLDRRFFRPPPATLS